MGWSLVKPPATAGPLSRIGDYLLAAQAPALLRRIRSRPTLPEGGRGPQDGRLVATPADDVQANRQAVGGEAAGNAGGGVTDHVDREGKGQVAPEGVDGLASDGLWPLANRESRHRHSRCE